MKRGALSVALVAALALAGGARAGGDKWRDAKAQAKRAEIDAMAGETLEMLLGKNETARALQEQAYGYAVFEDLKISLGLSGGGGNGVAVNKATDDRVYMKMGTAGIGLGLGAQKYRVVFFFQDRKTFHSFVRKGWQADASANAVAGKSGANVQARFVNGVAVYQITRGGLMLQADIAGTKYWRNKSLSP